MGFLLFWQAYSFESGQSLLVVFGNDLFDGLFHMQAVVDGLYLFDFFFLVVVDAQCEEMRKAFAVFFRSQFKGFQVELGLLVFSDVAAMAFAENFHVAI